jgi:hypothetical protein
MFAKLINAVRHKDFADDPVTRAMSDAKQANEVAAARASDTLAKVFDDEKRGLKVSNAPQ